MRPRLKGGSTLSRSGRDNEQARRRSNGGRSRHPREVITPKRQSLGGIQVRRSLETAGFEVQETRISLYETAKPARGGHSAILVQNAWNVVPEPLFRTALRKYPPPMRPRIMVRRRLAQFNLARARTVVTFTEQMANYMRQQGHPHVVVSPVDAALNPGAATGQSCGDRSVANFRIVVPGTITWYKRPQLALDIAARVRHQYQRTQIALVGPKDSSGCFEDIARRAAAGGHDLVHEVYPSDQMRRVLSEAGVVLTNSMFEALDLTFAEAIASATTVIASPIGAHIEMATRLNATVNWIGRGNRFELASHEPVSHDLSSLLAQWTDLGLALGLKEAPSVKAP